MAQLNMSFEHGQPWDSAVANFEAAVAQAQGAYSRWIHTIRWSEDRTSAAVSGPSYEVLLALDTTHVHARGRVPLAFKLMEPSVRRFIERTLQAQRSGSA